MKPGARATSKVAARRKCLAAFPPSGSSLLGGIAVIVLLANHAPLLAQNRNHFGGQDRANAAQRLILLGIQQAIRALPPAAGQAPSFEYDGDIPVRTTRLGPTSLHTSRPVGANRLSVRIATSAFHVSKSFGPITHWVAPEDTSEPGFRAFTKVGLKARVEVALLTTSVSYGIGPRLDATISVPLAFVEASTRQVTSALPEERNLPPRAAAWAGTGERAQLDPSLAAGFFIYRSDSFDDLGFRSHDGSHVGLGRIGLGLRQVLYSKGGLHIAAAPEFFIPSPDEDKFAGSESAAILPRIVGEWAAMPTFRFLSELAYEYDFDHAELRRFTASAGVLLPHQRFSVDAGVRASAFDRPITWTPSVARGQETTEFPATIATALENNRVGDDFIDMVVGAKVRLPYRGALSAAVTVPLNDQGFRADVVGTVGIETSF